MAHIMIRYDFIGKPKTFYTYRIGYKDNYYSYGSLSRARAGAIEDLLHHAPGNMPLNGRAAVYSALWDYHAGAANRVGDDVFEGNVVITGDPSNPTITWEAANRKDSGRLTKGGAVVKKKAAAKKTTKRRS